MRYDPASGAIIIMLRSLKMYSLAQAVTDLMDRVMVRHWFKNKGEGGRLPLKRLCQSCRNCLKLSWLSARSDPSTARQYMFTCTRGGGPGTGKPHAATALGVQAVEHHRRKVCFFSTIDLIGGSHGKRDERQRWRSSITSTASIIRDGGSQHWAGKARSLSNGRSLERALGAALKRDGSNLGNDTARTSRYTLRLDRFNATLSLKKAVR